MPSKNKINKAAASTSDAFIEKYDAFIIIDDYFLHQSKKKKKLRLEKNAKTSPASAVVRILERGLGDRIFSLEEKPMNENEELDDLVIGLKLNPDTCTRLIDRGPSANSTEATAFREIWGEKSEMRKFADGSICETVLWSGNSIMERRRIVENIAKYLLEKHFKIPSYSVHVTQHSIESVLLPSSSFSWCNINSTGEEQFRSLCESYDKLAGILRSLDGLPLTLTRVQGISPSLRHTEVFPPVTNKGPMAEASVYVRGDCFVPRPSGLYAPQWRQSHEVQITLEASSKWPENVEAVRRLKCAFYLKMSDLLREQFNVRSHALDDRLWVLLDSSIFRVVIVYPREAVLLKLKKDDRGRIVSRNNKESVAFELATSHASNHASRILGVVHANSTFPLTCRLIRRWVCCHMLSDYIRLEAVELLVSSLYLDTNKTSIPGSAFAGFLKFLRLLVSHDWLNEPLMINFNGELTDEQKTEIRKKFVSLRPTLPPMCLVTPTDYTGSRWTRPQPTAMIMERVCSLAKASLDILESHVFRLSENIVQAIFKPALDVYDALIHLRGRRISKRYMAFDQPEKLKKKINGFMETENRFPVVDFDPVEQYLLALKEKYDRCALFFNDSYGGDVIGVLWRPNVTRGVEGVQTETENGESTAKKIPDISVLLDEFSLLGCGLVEKVESRILLNSS